jgi:hypothetical protein
MIVSSLSQFEAFFQAFQGQFNIAKVVVGDYDDILALQSGEGGIYPMLFVELPNERWENNSESVFNTRILYLKSNSEDTRATVRTGLDDCRAQLREVIEAIYKTPTTALLYFIKDPKQSYEIDYKYPTTDDKLFGAHAEIRLKGRTKPC